MRGMWRAEPEWAYERAMRIAALACLVGMAACMGGPWPGRPPRYSGAVAKPIAGQDPELLAKVRSGAAKESAKYPAKVYWVAAPDWRPVRSLAGVVIGRHTANPVLAKVVRYDGSPDKWPDLCVYEEFSVRQDALDQQASLYAPPTIEGIGKRGEVDCKVYDEAPSE